jgi:AcrR family transcriptional regulator
MEALKESRRRKKERILEAAFRIFVEQGYTRTKMSAIAERTGFGKSTLYDYYGGKDEIFDELLRTKLVNPYLALTDAIVEDASATEKLRDMLIAEFDLFVKYSLVENLLPVIMTNPEFVSNPILRKAVSDVLLHKFGLIRKIVEEGMASGEFRKNDPSVVATQIMGASNAFTAALTGSACDENLPSISYDEAAREAFFSSLFCGLLP